MATYHSSSLSPCAQIIEGQAIIEIAKLEAEKIQRDTRQKAAAYASRVKLKLRKLLTQRKQKSLKNNQSLLQIYLQEKTLLAVTNVQQEALNLALSLTEQIIQSNPEQNSKALSWLLQQGLERFVEAKRVRIISHASELQVVENLLQEHFKSANYRLEAGAVTPGTICIETEEGQLQMSWKQALWDFKAQASDLIQRESI